MDVWVEIVEMGTEEVASRMGPMSEHRAERVERGASINLNHEKFYTRIVDKDGAEQ
jgi:hypothetical protein